MNRNTVKKKTLVSWSSGKDSAWALYCLEQDPKTEVVGLFTTLNEEYDRVNMHATPIDLLRRQADAVKLPLHEIRIPNPCSMEKYNATMQRFVEQCAVQGIERMAFGDLFLADIRQYREKQLQGTGIEPVFPLWEIPTDKLAEDMWASGLVAYISAVDLKKIPDRFVGQRWTREIIASCPKDCDPCGENGEFHTVVVSGPMFSHPISSRVGEIVERDGFAYADILPEDEDSVRY